MPARPRARPRAKIDLAHWQRMLDVNLTGAFLTVKAALPDITRARRASRATHRLHRLDRGPEGLRLRRGLLRGQARRRRPHPRAGGRAGAARRHGQRRVPRLHARRRCWRPRSPTSPTRPAARARRRGPTSQRLNPQGRFIQPEEVADTVLWLCTPAAQADHRPGHLGLGRRGMTVQRRPRAQAGAGEQAEAAAVAAAAARLARHRGRAARAPARRVRHDAAEVRRHGGARPQAGRHDHDRAVALPDGLQRQRHRHRRPAGGGRAGGAAGARRRPARHLRPPHAQGRAAVRRPWPRRTRPGSASCSPASAARTPNPRRSAR